VCVFVILRSDLALLSVLLFRFGTMHFVASCADSSRQIAFDGTATVPVAMCAIGRLVQGNGLVLGRLGASTQQRFVHFTSYPVHLLASPNLPYIISAQSDGVCIYSSRSGEIVQSFPLLHHAGGFAVCPDELRSRADFAAGYLPIGADVDVDALTPDQCAKMIDSSNRMLSFVSSRERVFTFCGASVYQLTMSPVLMVGLCSSGQRNCVQDFLQNALASVCSKSLSCCL
jgi:hypothetical protein